MYKLIILVYLLIFPSLNSQAQKFPERYYQDIWCKHYGGISEYKLKNRTRVDCLTTIYAIEFDFARKRDEALGQALRYARLTGKEAGIVLIILKPSDMRYVDELKETIKHYKLPVRIWTTGNAFI